MKKFNELRFELEEKHLTSAEKKKREEIAMAMEREHPDMPMGKKMAIATAAAKKVAEESNVCPTCDHDPCICDDSHGFVAEEVSKHRVLVTYSNPDHPMVSQRNERVQKHVRIPSTKQGNPVSQNDAVEYAKQFVKKQGFKIHDAEHVGLVKVNESADIKYVPDSGSTVNKAGHTYVGHSLNANGTKNSNIMKHAETGKYYAAGGSSMHPVKSTTFHDTPEEAAKSKK